jgi:hypothetical protein
MRLRICVYHMWDVWSKILHVFNIFDVWGVCVLNIFDVCSVDLDLNLELHLGLAFDLKLNLDLNLAAGFVSGMHYNDFHRAT